MNRRDAMTSIVGGIVTLPAIGQSLITPSAPAPEDRRKQYDICKERGHVAAPFQTENAVYFSSDTPRSEMCKFCGTYFRFVTTLEESNIPK